MLVLYVALGSAFGGAGRFLLGRALDERWQQLAAGLSVGTLVVNILGSFLIAALLPWCRGDERLHALLLFGLLGGFTTFSSFSLHTVTFLQRGAYGPALANIGLSLVCCLLACWLGFKAGGLLAAG
jgi:CrcB protein